MRRIRVMDSRLADLADDPEESAIGEPLSTPGPKESGQRIDFERLQYPAAEAIVRTSRRSDKAPSINPVPPGLHETYPPLGKHETASAIPRKPQLTPMTAEEIRSLTLRADSRGELSVNSRVVTHNTRDPVATKKIRNLQAMRNDLGKMFGFGVVFYPGEAIGALDTNIIAAPISCLWA